jgi:hypothetical protein
VSLYDWDQFGPDDVCGFVHVPLDDFAKVHAKEGRAKEGRANDSEAPNPNASQSGVRFGCSISGEEMPVGSIEEAFSGELDDATEYKVSWSDKKVKGKYLRKDWMLPSGASSNTAPTGPIWYPLQCGGEQIDGSIFISISITPMPSPTAMAGSTLVPTPALSRFGLDSLQYQDATIDILALGCRGLINHSFSPIEMPYVQFLLDPHFLREGNEAMPMTEPSREPTTTDPNFCTRSNPYLPHYRLPVRLPEDRRFMPGKLLFHLICCALTGDWYTLYTIH